MKATTLSVEDVKNLAEQKMVLQMPDFSSTVAARNQVSYVRRAYPLPKGKDYNTQTVKLDDDTYEFTVSVVNVD